MGANKIVMNTEHGEEVLMDLTGDSVTPETLAEGETAHDASGERIVGTMKASGGTTVQADMAQNDPTQADYVKNRTHWVESADVPIQGLWVNAEAFGGYVFAFSAPLGVEMGKSYIVTWDGVEYEGVAHEGEYNGIPCVCLGNTPLFFGTGDNGQPFALAEFPAEYVASAGSYGLAGATDFTINHEFSIKQETVHKLDNKFIDAEWMAKSTEETVLLPTTTLTPTGGVTGFADPATGVVTNYYNLTSFDTLNITIDKVPAASDMYILADGRKYYGTVYSQTIDGELTVTVYMFDTHLGVMVTHWISGSGAGSEVGAYCFIMAKESRDYTVSVGIGGRAVPLPEKYIPDTIPRALIGTTDEITPAQVAEALAAGRPIALTNTDPTYGTIVFNVFTYFEAFGAVQASGVFYSYGHYVAAVLGGSVAGGGWGVSIEPLAPASSVPTVQDIIDALPIYNGEVAEV